jgi:hypothetical protein
VGGIILVFLVVLAVVILLRPALIARARARRERLRASRPDAVIEHLEDHRKR